MKNFNYFDPGSVDEAMDLLTRYRETARPLAGGTDLIVQMQHHAKQPGTIVDLRRIPELRELKIKDDGTASIGSMVTMRELELHPVLRERFAAVRDGAAIVGSVQIRNLATLGGNIANAAPSADGVPGAIAMSATVNLAGPTGTRTMPLGDFFIGPGKTQLQPGELLTSIELPPPPQRSGGNYRRVTVRRAMDIAFVGVGAFVTLLDGTIAEARICLGAVAPTPVRAKQAESLLRGQTPSEKLLKEAGRLAIEDSSPIDDQRASKEYRKEMIRVLTYRTLKTAIERAGGNA